MLHELEQSPQMRALMQTQQVVVAHSRMEAFEKGRAMKRKGELGIPADSASSSINYILNTWLGNPSWTALRGKRVLDLASGSSQSWDMRIHHPHFARLTALNGAAVLAIDIQPQVGIDLQLFESVQADLVEVVLGDGLPKLEALQGRSFDIINSRNFIGYNPPNSLLSALQERAVRTDDFESLLLEQAGELLAEDGAMCLDTRNERRTIVYTKKGGQLVVL